ncbi:hypothetical protein [Novosphingobium sp. LASN5T]|uniref:hypothetical protein n=1 Tax=Novosphingobium sp. LASN5T TaxID=2491021 RepID=UPI000F5EFE82|nr:hypothetical protein [Novosphingobium sp. LASN5T]RQW40604.1 hypothetical protein EH199_20640 [Novosphingobium sp. LASN5T]
MTKIAKWQRIPTQEELAAFTGMHCARQYRDALASGWRCPFCRRNAHELVRWTQIRGPSWRARYGDEYSMGFTIVLTEHHCHNGRRFPPTRICGDCNSADGAAKRKLSLPEAWSFTPAEIGSFVTVGPHSGKTVIDYVRAQAIFDAAAQPPFRPR